MLVNRQTFPRVHLAWLLFAVLLTGGSASWYGLAWHASERPPGGGSPAGLTLGVVAALICFFECALVLRKTRWFRTRRRLLGIPLGTARAWMAAHIWLGLLVVPLVVMHTGFQLGGTLATLLAAVFLVVILSGVLGLILQNVLPRLMTEQVPDETIYSQIDEVGRQLAADAVRLTRLYGGPGPDGYWAQWDQEENTSRASHTVEVVTIGAARQVGTFIARSPQPVEDVPRGADSPELRRAVRDDVVEFLVTGKSSDGRFDSEQRIQWYFDDLRRRVRPEAVPAVDQIESLCQRRRQFRLQARIHFWLHSWLSLHLPLSVALIGLLVTHIIVALAYS